MGLAVTTLTDLERIPDKQVERDRHGDPDPEWVSDNNLITLHKNAEDHSSQMDNIKPGIYAHQTGTEFSAGSYTVYNSFRRELAAYILQKNRDVTPETPDRHIWKNLENYQDLEFIDLINFTDCDGFIGPETSARLADQFHSHMEDFTDWVKDNYSDTDTVEHLTDTYKMFADVFTEADNYSGAVLFH